MSKPHRVHICISFLVESHDRAAQLRLALIELIGNVASTTGAPAIGSVDALPLDEEPACPPPQRKDPRETDPRFN